MKGDECHGLKDALAPSGCSCAPGVSDAFLYVVKGAHLCLCCSGQGLLLVPQCVSCDSCLAGSDDAEHEGKPSGLGSQQRRERVRLSLIVLLGCDTAKLHSGEAKSVQKREEQGLVPFWMALPS